MAFRDRDRALQRFRYEYGAEPLHLLATIASLAIATYAFLRIFENPSTGAVLLWLFGAVVAHDLIAMPLYSLLLRIAEEGAEGALRPRRLALLTLNHIRIPAALSLLLLAVSLGLILELDQQRFQLTTGLDTDRYLRNWLLLTAGLFAISGLGYALALRRGRARRPIAAQRRSRQPPSPAPSRTLRILAAAVLAIGVLLTAWAAAIAVYGIFASFPL